MPQDISRTLRTWPTDLFNKIMWQSAQNNKSLNVKIKLSFSAFESMYK